MNIRRTPRRVRSVRSDTQWVVFHPLHRDLNGSTPIAPTYRRNCDITGRDVGVACRAFLEYAEHEQVHTRIHGGPRAITRPHYAQRQIFHSCQV